MEAITTTKGQIVIPAELRRKYGIKAGTRIRFVEDGERIIMQPITAEYIRSLRGSLQGNRAMKVLIEERQKDKKRQP
jgi:AbrB family looped-hinge helix DNA binding protein